MIGNADLVLSSNAIFTGLTDTLVKGSVAIKDGRIQAVGTIEKMERYIGADTTVYHYGDQMIMAGFQDFHIHLFLGSLCQESVSLRGCSSEEAAARKVKEFADNRPDDPWVIGFQWYHIYWEKKELPHRSSLDKLIPDRPVFLLNEECHGAWLNSKALEICGIDKYTPDPPFGEIARDESGEPTGFLYETAMGLAREAFQSIPKERQIQVMEQFLKKAARLGITTVNDMLPLPNLELGDPAFYQEFEQAGKLTTRIQFLSTLDGDLERACQLRDRYHSDKLKFSGLKQFLDGVPTTYTAFLTSPYSDRPDTCGSTLLPEDTVKKWAVEADKEGFRIRFHACGDGAVQLALDCFEEAQKQNGVRDARHTIEHIEVIHPDDSNRFEKLGVIASMQPEHMAAASLEEHEYVERLGTEREPFTWPIYTLINHGARMAFGSDYPVVDLDPLTEIYRAVTRLHDDGLPDGGWNPEEKISLAEALRCYTKGSAYGSFQEQESGTIEEGKWADIIVLDRNLFTVPAADIRKAEVLLTIMDGQIVFEKEGVENT
ncbi:amidohydrolase [Bacillus piscicola]|uniref:amidohydrolase n=1 Tax=Bacillus piscicola TaxID=1632684 RepID=UPI001F0995DB|nr:amidohydrolase family protein [Bacillus piscicola]